MQQSVFEACAEPVTVHRTSTRCRAVARKMYVTGVSATALTICVAGCAPTVKVEAPEKPIEITMNVNINHEIRVKVEKDIEELVDENPDLY